MTDGFGVGLGIDAEASGKIILALGSVKEEIQRTRRDISEARRQDALERIRNYIPLNGNVVLDANGNGIIDLGQPTLGRSWTVRSLNSAIGSQELNAQFAQISTSGNFAAAAAGSISAPAGTTNVLSASGTFGNAATAQSMLVTLSGVSGGPITFEVGEELAAGSSFSQTFPGNGLPATGTVTLSYPAVAGSAPGSLVLVTQTANSQATVGWYLGTLPGAPGGFANAARPTAYWFDSHTQLPGKSTYTSDIFQCRYGEHLFAMVSGGTVGAVVVCNARVLDEPVKSGVQVQVG